MPCPPNLVSQSTEIVLYDLIGQDDASARGFHEQLKAAGTSDIDVRINSAGGSIIHGLAMMNGLMRYRGHVAVFIDGIAFSMASAIAMAGDSVAMVENGLMMIHNVKAPSPIMKDAEEMRSQADMLERANNSLVNAYANRTGLPPERIMEMMAAETTMDAEEALNLGFIDEIIPANQAAASVELPDSVQLPQRYQAKLDALFDHKDEKPMSETQTPPAATIEELQALGADAEFVLQQLQANATLAVATAAWNQQLMQQLNQERERNQGLVNQVADLEAKAEERTQGAGGDGGSKPAPKPQPAPPQPEPTAQGLGVEEPVASGPPQDTQSPAIDVVALHGEKMQTLIQGGMEPAQAYGRAYTEIQNEYPALVEAVGDKN